MPDGTKDVLKALANRRGYMGLSDFLRDLVRRELQEEKKAVTVKAEAATTAQKAKSAAELGAPTP